MIFYKGPWKVLIHAHCFVVRNFEFLYIQLESENMTVVTESY